MAGTFTPRDVLRYCAVPETRELYIIGVGQRRITIKSQQIRALNLVWALDEVGLLRGARVAVIGAGFAGLTAACAAWLRGARVTLFESEWRCLHVQDGCEHRRVHANLFDWPEGGSLSPNAGLPILNWSAGSARFIVRHVREAASEFLRPGGVNLRLGTLVQAIGADDARVSSFSKKDSISADEEFDILIAAVGLGIDAHSTTPGYWKSDDLEQYQPTGDQAKRSILVFGNGDGGVIDALRASLGDADHPLLDWVERTLIPLVPPSLQRELLEMEREALHKEPGPASVFLNQRYDELLLCGLDSLEQAIAKRMRPETTVRLTGRTPTPYSLGATPLNRFLLALLRRVDPRRTQLEYLEVRPGTEPPKGPDDELRVLRTGPREILKKLFDSATASQIDNMPRDYDAPRIPQYPTNFFRQPLPSARTPAATLIRGPYFVPLTEEHHEHFLRGGILEPRMRRRGPFGHGHYACKSELDARAAGEWLLKPKAPSNVVIAAVELPNDPTRQVRWEDVTRDQTGTPEYIYTSWAAAAGISHDALHGPFDIGGTVLNLYCFHAEHIGAPWSGVSP